MYVCWWQAQIVLKLCQKWSMWRHKMREIRGEVGKKTLKKEIDNPSFLWHHVADFLNTLSFYLFTTRIINKIIFHKKIQTKYFITSCNRMSSFTWFSPKAWPLVNWILHLNNLLFLNKLFLIIFFIFDTLPKGSSLLKTKRIIMDISAKETLFCLQLVEI